MSIVTTDAGQPPVLLASQLDACAASYARFSSDYQRDESIENQQEACRNKAAANGHAISSDMEFSDCAISGTKLARAGLEEMLAAARVRRFRVLYLYSLSRLSRESVITLPLLTDLVHNHDVRVVCTSEGIDTDHLARPTAATKMVSGQWVHKKGVHP